MSFAAAFPVLQSTAATTAVGLASGVGLLLVVSWVIFAFNRLVRHANLVKEAWSGIDVQLKRRHDLVGNLVEAVKQYASFERTLLEEITRLRTQGEQEHHLKRLQGTENQLTDRLKTLLALVEKYPDLRASDNFLALQRQLVEIEDHLQMARRYYNGTVRDHNTRVESFPANLVAKTFGFDSQEFFEIETATHREAPRVEMTTA